MNVVATSSFNKDISRIKEEKVVAQLEKIIRSLESIRSIRELKSIKKMKGATDAYRIRMGDYRIGFYLVENTIKLTIVASRKDIYNRFP